MPRIHLSVFQKITKFYFLITIFLSFGHQIRAADFDLVWGIADKFEAVGVPPTMAKRYLSIISVKDLLAEKRRVERKKPHPILLKGVNHLIKKGQARRLFKYLRRFDNKCIFGFGQDDWLIDGLARHVRAQSRAKKRITLLLNNLGSIISAGNGEKLFPQNQLVEVAVLLSPYMRVTDAEAAADR